MKCSTTCIISPAVAVVNPEVYIENNVSADWDWDANTKMKAQGLLHSLKGRATPVAEILRSPLSACRDGQTSSS